MVKKLVWFLFFAALAFSCLDEPDCFSLNNDIIGIAFKKLSDRAADTVSFDRITVEGSDSILFSDILLTNTGINLPLNYYKDQTIYHFEGPAGNFILQLDYKAQTQFVSKDCGERFVLTGLSATSEEFDSLRLLGSVPKRDRQAGTHLEIYRCPDMSRIKVRVLPADSVVTGIHISYSGLTYEVDDNIFTIPLNVDSDQSAIQFEFADGSTRDLVFSYSRKDSTLFNTCGPRPVLTNLDTVSSTFSETKILSSIIRDALPTNIEVTF